jgi:hypothetical protein
MSNVERYQGPIRSAFSRILADLPGSVSDEVLQSSVKVVYVTLAPEGFTQSLLVYGSFPRPARNIPADTQL